jgi:hypothetical protein
MVARSGAQIRSTSCLFVGGEGTRIGGEVFLRGELRRVDEDRDDHARRALLGDLDQGEMAGMKRAHGRHQRDGFVLRMVIGDGALELRQCLDDAQRTLPFRGCRWWRRVGV